MKKNSFFCILLILCSLGLYSSCSNDDIKTEEQPNQSSLAEQLNKSKLTTIEHNIMLDNFYNSLKKNPISVNLKSATIIQYTIKGRFMSR